MSSKKMLVPKDTFAQDFHTAIDGFIKPESLEAAMKSIVAVNSSVIPINGAVASLIFYLKFRINVNGTESFGFEGQGGGITVPGGGALFGDVYTDDVDRLYRDTVSFLFIGTPVYLNMTFFDKDNNLLGHLEAGAVSIVVGVGGGLGRWSE